MGGSPARTLRHSSLPCTRGLLPPGAEGGSLALPHPILCCKLPTSGDEWQEYLFSAGVSMTHDDILTIPEVADLLRIAEKTVYALAQKGELPAFKVGGQWRFSRGAIQIWIEERTRAAQRSSGPPSGGNVGRTPRRTHR